MKLTRPGLTQLVTELYYQLGTLQAKASESEVRAEEDRRKADSLAIVRDKLCAVLEAWPDGLGILDTEMRNSE